MDTLNSRCRSAGFAFRAGAFDRIGGVVATLSFEESRLST